MNFGINFILLFEAWFFLLSPSSVALTLVNEDVLQLSVFLKCMLSVSVSNFIEIG